MLFPFPPADFASSSDLAKSAGGDKSSAAAQDVTFEAPQNQTASAEADQTPPGGDGLPASSESTGEGKSQDSADQTAGAASVGEEDDDAKFEQRWRSLQGINRSLQTRNSELQGRVEGLENMLAQMQDLRERPPSPDTQFSASEADPNQLTEEEVQAYGGDFISVVTRIATAAATEAMAEVKKDLLRTQKSVQSIGATQTASAEEQVRAKLDEVVPAWRELNADPEFIAWLKQDDPFAGESRLSLLRGAFGANDSQRCIRFFKTYQEEQAAVSKAVSHSEPKPTNPGKGNGKGNGKVDLATLASPGRGSGSSADTQSSEARPWKESEIADFYEDVRKGKFRGRDDEKRAIEADLQAAISAGNITIGQ